MNVEKYLFKIPPHKIRLGLHRTKKLLDACNNPEKTIFSIQIVGTNGKGSTAAMLTNIFKKKHKVGLFTSPHLVSYKERITINFKKISNKDIEVFLKKHKKAIEKIKPTFFEIMTTIAMWYFKKNKVDIAILETGLGGRLDSVTACNNNVVAYTNITKDHQTILGNTIELITKEKAAAIINSKQIIFSAKQKNTTQRIIEQRAKAFNISVIMSPQTINYKLKYLIGEHQKRNASLANTIVKNLINKQLFKISNIEVKNSIENTCWPGRFQRVYNKPTIIYDVAHNNAGLRAFHKTYKDFTSKKLYDKTILICAFEHNKEIRQGLNKLKNLFDCIICTETGIKNSMDCKSLAKTINKKNIIHNKNIRKTLQSTLKKRNKNKLICIIGSHYFGPYIKEIYNKSFANISKSVLT